MAIKSIVGSILLGLFFLTSSALVAEEAKEIPNWIKNNAKWWAQGQISITLDPNQSMKSPYIFDGRELCMENPCPKGPSEICFPNTDVGHAMFIAMINELCAFNKSSGAWDVFDLPRPAPSQERNIQNLSPIN